MTDKAQLDDIDFKKGFALSWRRKWEHIIFKNYHEAALWAWMTDVAKYVATDIKTQHGPVHLERGQLLISERGLEKAFNMHRNTVRRIIHQLVNEGMISLNRDHSAHKSGTIVTIVNYDKYQTLSDRMERLKDQGEEITGPVEDHSRTTQGPQVIKDNKYKSITPLTPQGENDGKLKEKIPDHKTETPEKRKELFEKACKLAEIDTTRSMITWHEVDLWLREGCSDKDILNTIARVADSKQARGEGPAVSLKYFTKAITDARDKRLAEASTAPEIDWHWRMEQWDTGYWGASWGPEPFLESGAYNPNSHCPEPIAIEGRKHAA